MNLTLRIPVSIAIVALTFGACRGLDPVASEELARGAGEAATLSAEQAIRPPATQAIESAVNNPRRSPADRKRDQQRRAREVLEFFGIEPGMTVLDLFSGGGYYTELLSYTVGASGTVVAHSRTPAAGLTQSEIDQRIAEGRLSNVERVFGAADNVILPSNRFDAVLMILAYHDLYRTEPETGGQPVDRKRFLAEVYASMKPGAVLGVVDHVAEPGSTARSAQDLHRIDPEIIKRDLVAAGFVFAGSSDILRNPDDRRTRSVFAADVRGTTDRAVLRFRKPASAQTGG